MRSFLPITTQSLMHMRRMGIDYGSKKVGIAFTDEGGGMAFPHSVLPNDSALMGKIKELIDEKSVQEIVVGHSLDKNGEPNPIHKHVEELITDITLSVGLPVHLEPEQYTSQQAARVTGKNEQIDASAAALILEGYIQKQN